MKEVVYAKRLLYWKPVGSYLYLIKDDGWKFWGYGSRAGDELVRYAVERQIKLIRSPGPKFLPASVSEARAKFPEYTRN